MPEKYIDLFAEGVKSFYYDCDERNHKAKCRAHIKHTAKCVYVVLLKPTRKLKGARQRPTAEDNNYSKGFTKVSDETNVTL